MNCKDLKNILGIIPGCSVEWTIQNPMIPGDSDLRLVQVVAYWHSPERGMSQKWVGYGKYLCKLSDNVEQYLQRQKEATSKACMDILEGIIKDGILASAYPKDRTARPYMPGNADLPKEKMLFEDYMRIRKEHRDEEDNK